MPAQQFSRRQILVSMGLATTGLAACIGGGFGLLSIAQSSADASDGGQPQTSFAQPIIVSRADWGAQLPNHHARNENGFFSDEHIEGWRVYENELHTHYQTAVIHHSVIYETDDLTTVIEVQRLHQVRNGWADVGYHFLIGKNGLIYEGRDWGVRGTHVGGYNTGSIGICLLGNFMNDSVTQPQYQATEQLLQWLAQRLQLTHVASHRDFNDGTLCPGDKLYTYLEQLATAANLNQGIDGYMPPGTVCSCCECDTDQQA